MLKSEELLQKYRAAENSGATEPELTKTEAETDSKPAEASTEPAAEPQPATASETVGDGTTKTTADTDKDASRTRLQRDFEKRLNRQERSHQAQMAALRKEFEDYKKSHEAAKPELKPEDFNTRSDYDAYKSKQLEDSVFERIQKTQAEKEERERAEAEQAEKVDAKLKKSFGSEEAIRDFQDTMGEFMETEKEFLATENGQLFQEFIDESPLGLIIAKIIAKSPDAVAGLKRWSSTMMMDELHRFEDSLNERIKASQKQMAEKSKATAEATPAKPTMPSTGAIGKTSASSGKFDAREYLRQKYPERYGRK